MSSPQKKQVPAAVAGSRAPERQMGTTAAGMAASVDEEACMYAFQLVSSSILPMTLKSVIELGLLEILVAGSVGGKAMSPAEVAAKLPSTANPGAPDMVDRMLRLLASYDVVSCVVVEEDGGGLAAASVAATARRRCASGSPPTRTASPSPRSPS